MPDSDVSRSNAVEATSFAGAVSSAEEHLILSRAFAGVDHVTLIILYRGY